MCCASPKDTIAFTEKRQRFSFITCSSVSCISWKVFPFVVFLGEDFKTVQKEVADILNGRILVGHALRNDLKVPGRTAGIFRKRLQ